MKKYKIRNWIIKGDQRQTIRRRERVANWRWRSCWTTNGATNLFTFLVCCVLFFGPFRDADLCGRPLNDLREDLIWQLLQQQQNVASWEIKMEVEP
jgi:hypothetical protein